MALLTVITTLFLAFTTATSVTSQPISFKYLNYNCTNAQSTAPSFIFNLNSLLSNLTSLSLFSLYANYTVDTAGPDRIFGLYFCTGDLPQSDCRNCILTASTDLPNLCGANRTGIVWYDYCQLRYSDRPLFGIPDADGFSRVNPTANLSDPSVALGIVARLADEAPHSSPLKFAFYADVDDQMYGLAQCSNDLNATACSSCLSMILGKVRSCCSQARGWRYMSYSCWVRYEATPFLKNINVSTELVEYACVRDIYTDENFAVMNSTLNSLLSSLASQGPSTGFYNTSIAAGGVHLYGLVLCRGDVNYSTCAGCLRNSHRYLLRNCPKSSGGLVWYERCQMRYWDRNFFGVVGGDQEMIFCNEKQATEDADKAVNDMMSAFVEKAPTSASMFASGSVRISDSLVRYGLVQCTRDLAVEECRRCLNGGLVNVSSQCKQKKGWRYLSPSCNLRYEDFAFFDLSPVPVDQLQPTSSEKSKTAKIVVVAVVAAFIGVVLIGCLVYILLKKKNRVDSTQRSMTCSKTDNVSSTDLPTIDVETIQEATDNFSISNKLGEGGFGPVYKGVLPNGKEVAVKRLSAASSQGTEEFKTEVRLIAKLQHRNLVRLVGCCIDGEEKLLVYEYMPNGSLDTFLFDEQKRLKLNWITRQHIFLDIARGMVYLHEDSQLRVVHRDLKAGNILLDHDMNPKISDFGMARIFRYDQDQAQTRKIVGTLGYMPPEYAMHGLFSVKSDVFSFGVLLLEIISGQKNGRSFFMGHHCTLLDHAWLHWKDGRCMEIVDPVIAGSCPTDDAMRGIHVALLCVQEEADERPEMSMVLHMLLSRELTSLRDPKQPPSYMRQDIVESSEDMSSSNEAKIVAHSINQLTLSAIEGR